MTSQRVGVIDVGIGNLASVMRAIDRAGGQPQATNDPDIVRTADKLVFPGVGAFQPAMAAVDRYALRPAVIEAVVQRGTPILGLCLGMQLLARVGFEDGECGGLGLVDAEVKQLNTSQCGVLPHIGWNNLDGQVGMRLFEDLGSSPHFYFVHSYHMTRFADDTLVATCTYGSQIVTASIQRGNVYGAQFHPEKSSTPGIAMLRNFIENA